MLCKCGCGEETPPPYRGEKVRMYVNPTHRARRRAQDVIDGRAAAEADSTVPIEQFSATLLRIKKEKGYTWAQMAQLTGRTVSHLSGLATTKGKKRIRKETVADILHRLGGGNAIATPQQRKAYAKQAIKVQTEDRVETKRQKAIEERNAKVQALSLRLGASAE